MRFAPHREDELKKMLSSIPHQLRPQFDQWFRIAVKEAIELSHKNQDTTSMQSEDKSESRSLELRFSNSIIPTLFTGDHIQAIGGVPLEVTLVESRTKEAVKSGPEASGKVEILVLEAEVDGVTGEDVKNNSILVRHMEGSRSSRVDNLCLNLIQGAAILPMVSFVRNDKWMKNSKLRLGAKFVNNSNGVRVKEAKSGSFLLKDRRTKAYAKHYIPSLHDEIWRLRKVDRHGCLAKNMEKAEIITVGDFLVHLFRQTQRLKEIFDHSNHAKSWRITVEHARECPAKLQYCSSFDPKTRVFFNVSGEVLGLFKDKSFLSSDKLTQTQKEAAKNLVISAFENWGDVIHVEQEGKFVPKTEPVTLRTFGKHIFLDDLDLNIDETCLFGNMVSDGKCPDLELLPESLRRKYNEIYNGFESLRISNRSKLEGDQRYRLCNRLKILFCVVTFKIRSFPENGLDDIHAHKKPRLS
ncbi:calmodulin-binding protein 60 A [Lactuca sativa]|uniref:calmodulin-binding protein 60 A n=1 Tax=Lactuca sativa TaxID=4236 RepID=UPI000CD85447|nr:calmodulin-binding protein 60 A [Lactuca sativa]